MPLPQQTFALITRFVFASTLAALPAADAQTLTAQAQLAAYVKASGTPASASAGQTFFSEKHGKDWSCSTCHTTNPLATGKHATTGKAIAALAPAGDTARFTDAARTEKWFTRNCNDVLGRECTASEKANVLAWLLAAK